MHIHTDEVCIENSTFKIWNKVLCARIQQVMYSLGFKESVEEIIILICELHKVKDQWWQMDSVCFSEKESNPNGIWEDQMIHKCTLGIV